MKIIYVLGYPLQNGGHFKSALDMLKNLEAMGHHIWVMAPPGGVDEMVREYLKAGAEIVSLPEVEYHSYFPSLRGISRIIKLINQKDIDVIHVQDPNGLWPGYMAAIRMKKGFVYTRPGGAVEGTFPPVKAQLVVYSQELQDGMPQKYGLKKENIHLIRARIDRNVYKPAQVSAGLLTKYNLPNSDKKLAMAIRLDEDKRPWINTILNVAESFAESGKDVQIIIAGTGTLLGELREKASQINQKSECRAILHFIGPIYSSNELNQFYNYSDVVVGHGQGILEAMACRKPVVVLGENGQGEAVEPENIDDVAYFNFSGRHFRNKTSDNPLPFILEQLLSDTDTQKKLGGYGYEYIESTMDARIAAQQLVEVYNKALGQEPDSLLDGIVWYAKASKQAIRLGVRERFQLLFGKCRGADRLQL